MSLLLTLDDTIRNLTNAIGVYRLKINFIEILNQSWEFLTKVKCETRVWPFRAVYDKIKKKINRENTSSIKIGQIRWDFANPRNLFPLKLVHTFSQVVEL